MIFDFAIFKCTMVLLNCLVIVLVEMNPTQYKNYSKSDKKYTEDEIVNMMEFLIDNLFVQFGGRVFQHTIGIPMGTNCAPILDDLFLYSYESDFLDGLLKQK